MKINLEELKAELELNRSNSNPYITEGSQKGLLWTEYPPFDMEDDNKSFTLELYAINDNGEYELSWDGDTFPSGGEYSKLIKNMDDFDEAMNDWETMRNWE